MRFLHPRLIFDTPLTNEKVSLAKINMSSTEAVQQIREFLAKYGDYSTDRGDEPKELLFLPGEQCPTGLVPCDSSTETCPDVGLWPKIYNSKGLRCYSRENVAHKKSMTKEDAQSAVKGIRALVEEVSKTQRLMAELESATPASAAAPASALSSVTSAASSAASAVGDAVSAVGDAIKSTKLRRENDPNVKKDGITWRTAFTAAFGTAALGMAAAALLGTVFDLNAVIDVSNFSAAWDYMSGKLSPAQLTSVANWILNNIETIPGAGKLAGMLAENLGALAELPGVASTVASTAASTAALAAAKAASLATRAALFGGEGEVSESELSSFYDSDEE